MTTPDFYIPGSCNLDHRSSFQRAQYARVVLVIGVVVISTLFIYHVPAVFRAIAAFGFAFGTLINLFQARARFCVANGLSGTYEQHLRRHAIEQNDAAFKLRDRARATSLITRAFIYSLLISAIGFLPL